MNALDNYDWGRLGGLGFDLSYIEKTTGGLKDACWKGYTAIGMKKKGGRMVPNCVPLRKKTADHKEGDLATAEMTPNFLPNEPGEGDEKNPQMTEGIRMPRMEDIRKAANKNPQLAMHASVNDSMYSEYVSEERNGAMAINQLRVMQEKIEIMLDILSSDDNLEPWMASKLTMSSQNLASVADYLRFGVEH